MGVMAFLEPAFTTLQIAGAVLLFCYRLPRQEGFGARLVVVAAVVAAFVPLAVWASSGPLAELYARYRMQAQFALFSLILAALLPTVAFLWQVSVWTSFFCCTAAYTMQNLATALAAFIDISWQNSGLAGHGTLWSFFLLYGLSTAIAYDGCYLVLIRRMRHEGLELVQSRRMAAMVFLVVLVVILFDIANKSLPRDAVALWIILLLRAVHISVCVFVLFSEYEMLYAARWRADAQAMAQLALDSRHQYQLSQQNVEAINAKCHDLKRQIRALSEDAAVDAAALAELERAVGIYDAAVKTGNDALDIILSEKSLVCEQRGITLSCIADGACLERMAPSDLYALLGNALDNAIEAATGLADPARRSVSLVVHAVHGAASIHVENFYDESVALELDDGLPKTTKRAADGTLAKVDHGFGLNSMRQICEHYDGTLAVNAETGIFKLDMLIPLA